MIRIGVNKPLVTFVVEKCKDLSVRKYNTLDNREMREGTEYS